MRSARVVAAFVAATSATAAFAAGAWAAGPVLDLQINHGPTNLVAGEEAQYRLIVQNMSATPAEGPLTVRVDPLPAGLTATKLAGLGMPGSGNGWDCDLAALTCTTGLGLAPGRSLVSSVPLSPYRSEPIHLEVAVDSGASGSKEVSATLSAGGDAVPASETDSAVVSDEVPSFGIRPGSFEADAFDRDGRPLRQAGAAPFIASVAFEFNQRITRTVSDQRVYEPVDNLRTVRMELPRGLIGNPQATAKCGESAFTSDRANVGNRCPVESQVGTIDVGFVTFGSTSETFHIPVYNLTPARGLAASFGFTLYRRPVRIAVRELDPKTYAVVTDVSYVNETFPVLEQRLTLWGDPSDPAHDADRYRAEGSGMWGIASPGLSRTFLAMPTECGVAGTNELSVESWQRPGVFTDPVFAPDPGVAMSGCEKLPFAPSVSVRPTVTSLDSPSGLDVDLDFAQTSDPSVLRYADLREAVVTLPEGMTINPAGADGLQACTDAQLGLGTSDPAGCPDGSKVGAVSAVSPLLDRPLDGAVYIRSQNSADPASGEMFRLAIVLDDPDRGLRVKLAGSVRADPATGRLVTTFDDNPQMPVSRISVRLKGGDRAPLATPPTCGVKTSHASLSSWGGQVRNLQSSFTIPCPADSGFAPGFKAGTVNPTGGKFSPFVALIERRDGDQYLSRVDVDLPKGLVAKLKGVQLCPDAVAGDGTPGLCPDGSRIGTATVGVGAGKPFHLPAPVYLTGPYNGGPYGLSVQVPAKAGPFDLGVVKVRNALHVDPVTAQVAVASDPLPLIVKGVPVRLRSVDVDVDRPGFAINPTSCGEKRVEAALTSAQAAVHRTGSRFQVGDCRSLGFKPRTALRLIGKRQTKTGGHPALKAVVTQPAGQANIKGAAVTLPKSIALDAVNAYDPKLVCDYDQALEASCPASSVIGRAVANTPVLNNPLAGNVHLVQGIRFGKSGNRIRTLPTLLVKLRGEVAIDLRAQTSTSDTSRLVTTFPNVPDAPVSKFTVNIKGGKKGILAVTRTRKAKIDLCAAKQIANVETDGHNGRRADYRTTVKTPCASKAKTGKVKKHGKRRPPGR